MRRNMKGKRKKKKSTLTFEKNVLIGWERSPGEETATPVFSPGKSQGQKSLVDYSPQGRKVSVGHN